MMTLNKSTWIHIAIHIVVKFCSEQSKVQDKKENMVTSKTYSFYSQVKNALSFLKKKIQNFPIIFLSEMVSNQKSSFQVLKSGINLFKSKVQWNHIISIITIYQYLHYYQRITGWPKYVGSLRSKTHEIIHFLRSIVRNWEIAIQKYYFVGEEQKEQ